MTNNYRYDMSQMESAYKAMIIELNDQNSSILVAKCMRKFKLIMELNI